MADRLIPKENLHFANLLLEGGLSACLDWDVILMGVASVEGGYVRVTLPSIVFVVVIRRLG